MIRYFLMVAVCLTLAFTSTDVQASNLEIFWDCNVIDSLGTHQITLNTVGGRIPYTSLTNCSQGPLTISKTSAGLIQEKISITCDVGIGTKVSLTQICHRSYGDRSFGALTINGGLENFSITLACVVITKN